MRLVISHMSALGLCSRLAEAGRRVAKACRIRSLRDCASAQRDVALFELSELPLEQGARLDILVADNNSRFATSSVRRHTWGAALPDGAFYQVGEGVYVTSPEFSLLLLSKELPFNNLVALCSEVCGCYARDGSARGFYDRPALTTVARVGAFLAKVESASGSAKLKRALLYAVENARSPMEATVGIMMCVPTRMGGFGLPKPELNHRARLSPGIAEMAGRNHVVFDFFFADHGVAVEYDSSQEHTGADRIASDARRNNALRHDGIAVINVTWAQVREPKALEAAMTQVAGALGRKLREPSPAGRARRVQLRADLLPRVLDGRAW